MCTKFDIKVLIHALTFISGIESLLPFSSIYGHTLDYSILLEVRGYNRRYICYIRNAIRMGNKKGKDFSNSIYFMNIFEFV